MNIDSHTFSFLRQLPLFSGLSEDEFVIVSEALKIIHVQKNETVFKEGDSGEEMFIFYSGALYAFGTQSDGTPRKLFDINPGNFFGEMSIIAHEPRSATIVSTEDSSLIMLQKKDFYRIINEYPIIGFKILRTIGLVQNKWLDQSSKSYNDIIRWGEIARRRAITDELTSLYNRSFLEESIKERFSNQSMNLRVMSLLMMDLDKIHMINERHGAKGGDLVIISAAEMIRSCLRPGDIPSRLAGDEFAILLPDTDKKSAVKIAEQIREKIEKKQIEIPESPGADKTVFINNRTSIGIAITPVHAKTMKELMETSDTALRKAKEFGRNRVEVFG
ncbi:MAG: GGDEF domain-containing protein [Treponema sp.]|jgi:diguanylate cyclase (GGDEF)-like protein|nr:GGDEF domain-containing protein [Treponema sp.]